jgi:hypothetical protein
MKYHQVVFVLLIVDERLPRTGKASLTLYDYLGTSDGDNDGWRLVDVLPVQDELHVLRSFANAEDAGRQQSSGGNMPYLYRAPQSYHDRVRVFTLLPPIPS